MYFDTTDTVLQPFVTYYDRQETLVIGRSRGRKIFGRGLESRMLPFFLVRDRMCGPDCQPSLVGQVLKEQICGEVV